MKYKHLFGPVISRRLGISLGVDLVPYKHCSMNCVYCEVGETTDLMNETEDFVSLTDIKKELRAYIAKNPKLDYITFSGSGEPLLYSKIGELINFIKGEFPEYKLALITNASHLGRKDIQDDLLKVDMIMPSMDAVDQPTFEKINRAHPDIKMSDIIDNLISFSSKYSGTMWLEIFFIPGVNDDDRSISLMKEKIKLIKPDRVQLNSLDRPGTEDWVNPEPFDRLDEIRLYLQEDIDPAIKIEVIKKVDQNLYDSNKDCQIAEDKIIATVSRRPCTSVDMSQMLGIHLNQLNKVLHKLVADGLLEGTRQSRGVFYRLKN